MAHYDRTGTPYIVHDAQNDRAQRKTMFTFTGGDPTVPAIVIDGKYVQSGWGSPPRG
jgi:glutaredoxin